MGLWCRLSLLIGLARFPGWFMDGGLVEEWTGQYVCHLNEIKGRRTTALLPAAVPWPASPLTSCHATMPWNQLTVDWNFCKLWGKINLSSFICWCWVLYYNNKNVTKTAPASRVHLCICLLSVCWLCVLVTFLLPDIMPNIHNLKANFYFNSSFSPWSSYSKEE